MFAISKLSNVIFALGGILAIASYIASSDIVFLLLVALYTSAAVYSLVSFMSFFDDEYSIPDDRA